MKNGEKELKDLISIIIGKIDNDGKLKKDNLSPDEEKSIVMDAISSQYKNLVKSKNDFADNIDEKSRLFIEKINREIQILEDFLPKQLTDEELSASINAIINEKDIDVKEKSAVGLIMKELKIKHGSSFDGKIASQLIKDKQNA